MGMKLGDDEIELAILQRYVEQYRVGEIADPDIRNKCSRELDMREVLHGLIDENGPELDHSTKIWLTRLASSKPYNIETPLLLCSDSRLNSNTHRYHARAFLNPGKSSAPAWDRIRELEAMISDRKPVVIPKELEQKFKILLGQPQEHKDFAIWAEDAKENQYQIAVLFFDIDNFKLLNTKYTETKVDEFVLTEAQYLIKRKAASRGGAYRHGGEEFVVILPNHDRNEALAFGEKIRSAFDVHTFNIDGVEERLTVSVGVALWPYHGESFNKVLQAANNAERSAKDEGRNRVKLAD